MIRSVVFSLFSLVIGAVTPPNSLGDEGPPKAIFAGGCFWCMEADFEKISGVRDVISGYTGGTGPDPTYEHYDENGYIEAVKQIGWNIVHAF